MSEKNRDHQGRWRNKTIAFRVSPEEYDKISCAVKLSGMTKQDFITTKLSDLDIKVYANPRVYKAIRGEIKKLTQELERICGGEVTDIDQDLCEKLHLIVNVLERLKGGKRMKKRKRRMTAMDPIVAATGKRPSRVSVHTVIIAEMLETDNSMILPFRTPGKEGFYEHSYIQAIN